MSASWSFEFSECVEQLTIHQTLCLTEHVIMPYLSADCSFLRHRQIFYIYLEIPWLL